MIKEFYIENFKSFSEPALAKIDDLLVLAGSNSGGKSTIIQALLLLSQTLDNSRSDVALDLGGKYIQFSEFREAVFGRPNTRAASFTIGFNLDVFEDDLTKEHFLNSKIFRFNLASREVQPDIAKTYNNVSIRIKFSTNQSGIPIISSTEYQKTIHNLGTIKYSFVRNRGNYKIIRSIAPERDINLSEDKKEALIGKIKELFGPPAAKLGRYFLSPIRLPDLFQQFGFNISDVPDIGGAFQEYIFYRERKYFSESTMSDVAKILKEICEYTYQKGISDSSSHSLQFEHFLLPSSRLYGVDPKSQQLLETISGTFGSAIKEIRDYLRRIQYIGPLRARPERAYLSTGTPIGIGNAGENAIPICRAS